MWLTSRSTSGQPHLTKVISSVKGLHERAPFPEPVVEVGDGECAVAAVARPSGARKWLDPDPIKGSGHPGEDREDRWKRCST